jgi:hypothetical protein
MSRIDPFPDVPGLRLRGALDERCLDPFRLPAELLSGKFGVKGTRQQDDARLTSPFLA